MQKRRTGISGTKEIEKASKLLYQAPLLTVFGKAETITKATSLGPKMDGVECNEGHSNCLMAS